MTCAQGLLSVCVCCMASPEELQVLVPVLCGSKVHFDCGFLREEIRPIRVIWVICAGYLPHKLTTEQLRIVTQAADMAQGTPMLSKKENREIMSKNVQNNFTLGDLKSSEILVKGLSGLVVVAAAVVSTIRAFQFA